MTGHPDLLPEGLHDRLPPEAETLGRVRRAVLGVAELDGYVPLIEAGSVKAPLDRLATLDVGSPAAVGERLRAGGTATVAALTLHDDAAALGCTHIWADGVPTPLG